MPAQGTDFLSCFLLSRKVSLPHPGLIPWVWMVSASTVTLPVSTSISLFKSKLDYRPNRPGPCTAAREPSGLATGEAGRSAWLGNRDLAAGTARSRMPQLLCRAKARVREGQQPPALPVLTGPSKRRLHPHQATSLQR